MITKPLLGHLDKMEVKATTIETVVSVPVKSESDATSATPVPTKRKRRNMFDVKPEGEFEH